LNASNGRADGYPASPRRYGDGTLHPGFNDALEIRRLADRFGEPERRAISKALPDELALA
jgi:hypothetical protein